MSNPKDNDNKHYTYAQYKNWPEDESWELIRGVAYNMSPAPGLAHQKVSGEISRQIANYLDGKTCSVFTAPFDVFLPEKSETEKTTSTIVQPDISIICDNEKLSEKGCTGAPNIVLEIISPSGASRDHIVKRRLYEYHGVVEFWIIHPVDRIVWKYILTNHQYGKPEIFDHNDKPSFDLFPDLNIDLYKVFDVKESDYIKEPSPGYRNR